LVIEFNCPHCGKLLTTSDERAGARAKCPACDDLITVPSPAATLAGGVPSPGLAPTAAWSGADSTSPAPPRASGAVSSRVPDASNPSATTEYGSPAARPKNVCPNCRSEVEAAAAYCHKCGVSLWEPPLLHYAPFWRRVVALVIDLAIIGVVAVALCFPLWVVGLGRNWFREDLWGLIWLFYYAIAESSPAQATVGKWLVGIVVCGADGRRLRFPRAVIRTLAKILSGMICGVGYIMPLLTLRKQALHDVLTDAVVICK
jgi:uncharacterized RDD family membrane protein YckC